jgi:hypothetical protein
VPCSTTSPRSPSTRPTARVGLTSARSAIGGSLRRGTAPTTRSRRTASTIGPTSGPCELGVPALAPCASGSLQPDVKRRAVVCDQLVDHL